MLHCGPRFTGLRFPFRELHNRSRLQGAAFRFHIVSRYHGPLYKGLQSSFFGGCISAHFTVGCLLVIHIIYIYVHISISSLLAPALSVGLGFVLFQLGHPSSAFCRLCLLLRSSLAFCRCLVVSDAPAKSSQCAISHNPTPVSAVWSNEATDNAEQRCI